MDLLGCRNDKRTLGEIVVANVDTVCNEEAHRCLVKVESLRSQGAIVSAGRRIGVNMGVRLTAEVGRDDDNSEHHAY